MLQSGFFDLQNRYQKLSELGDPLEVMNGVVDWERFRPVLKKALKKSRKNTAGRRPYDSVLMFKVLVLQSLYNLSDDQTEYQIRDRFSFLRFLKLTPEAVIPDAKTVWLFRESLKEAKVMDQLFTGFEGYLTGLGYKAQKGTVVDARIVSVPKQRNSREENQTLKDGLIPADWVKQPAKLAQKDTQARWTRKHGKHFYGYKNHLAIDVKHKLVRGYTVTPASTHDSQEFETLLKAPNTRKAIWADGAYQSEAHAELLKSRGIQNHLHERPWKDQALTPVQRRRNKRRSRIRARVEHVFGHQVTSMRQTIVRTIGQARAEIKIGLANLAYNMSRLGQLERLAT
ncbi:MAG: IS5 family transposase [Gammaproteobacteria bacterium]